MFLYYLYFSARDDNIRQAEIRILKLCQKVAGNRIIKRLQLEGIDISGVDLNV